MATIPFGGDAAALASPRKTTVAVWLIGAAAALALHAGGVALAVAHMNRQDDDAAMGAPAIDVGVELASPQRDPSELPPGPDADASSETPPVVEQQQKVVDSALPKEQPTQTDDPDQQVAPEAPKQADEKQDDPTTAKAAASTESVASEATAMPSVETPQAAARTTAPAVGVGESAARVRATWQKQLVAHLNRHKRYPDNGARRDAQVSIRFTLDRLGHIVSMAIDRTSGDPAFDQAALAMMKRSDPAPAPPPIVADEGLSFSLPVIFRAGDKR